ncbi:hypothetical protein SISNIDRAFT_483651 [Sistotremastrum niveocremeum HHB9708]|uniref:Uncharacterized protein n=1 Tax=Sistotremastrum niveocremeum HHB9708 TaxID=1314777 RepID=A0A164WW41_9AGAM|nr:hypothetical protein SISNIDRAFT_483651 [Sistotremastrum niveocremeum HHB9708]
MSIVRSTLARYLFPNTPDAPSALSVPSSVVTPVPTSSSRPPVSRASSTASTTSQSDQPKTTASSSWDFLVHGSLL